MTASRAFHKLTTLLAAGLLTGTAAASPLTPTDLMFTVDGADLGIVPIALEAGDVNPVEYDLSNGQIRLTVADVLSGQYDDPLFCFDLNAAAPPVSLYVRDANGHPVLDGLTISSVFQYFPVNDEIRLVAQSGTKCFYRGFDSNEFGLFGQPPSANGQGQAQNAIFSSRFTGQGMALDFVGLPAFVTAGAELSYELTLTNLVGRPLENIGLQELFPANGDQFDATLIDGSFECSGSDGCPGSSLNDHGSLRFQGFSVAPGETLTLHVTRTVDANSEAGSTVKLYAAAVAGDSMLQPYDVAEAEITVVGAGDALVVSADPVSVDEPAVITVTALDAQQNPVPNMEIEVADADGLSIVPGSLTTGVNGQVIFQAQAPQQNGNAGVYNVEFTATPGGISGIGEIEFLAGAPYIQWAGVDKNTAVADGVDEIIAWAQIFDANSNPVPGVEVLVTNDGGLTTLPTSAYTNISGTATFTATSQTVGSYAFRVAAVGLSESPPMNVSFTAGDPASFEFYQGPFDTMEGHAMDDVIVRVVDANNNWVDDEGTIAVTLYVYQGQSWQKTIDTVVVENGEALFEAPDVSDLPVGVYTLVANGIYNSTPMGKESQPFDIYEAH